MVDTEVSLPHHLSFIFNHGRFEARALMTGKEAEALDVQLRAEAERLRTPEATDSLLRQVHVYPVALEERANAGQAQAMLDQILEGVSLTRSSTSATQALAKQAQILDDAAGDFLNSPHRAHAQSRTLDTIEVTFHWINDDAFDSDPVDAPCVTHFQITPTQKGAAQTFLGDLSDWLFSERLAEDFGYAPVAGESPPHLTAGAALATLGEAVQEMAGEADLAQVWGDFLGQVENRAPKSPEMERPRKSRP